MKKILLDTNILVPLEDNKIVPDNYSTLVRKLLTQGKSAFVHRASFDDIARDKDSVRKKLSLSKLEKYPVLEKSERNSEQLEQAFGPINKPNDESDCHLLSAVNDGAANILITEDADLHRRAAHAGLQDKVFRIRQYLDFIELESKSAEATLTFIEKKFCYQLDRHDPIFQSLKVDYGDFDRWWSKSCDEHRECWLVKDLKEIAGLVVFKDESSDRGDGMFSVNSVLKLCTFKVSESHRGGRLGEQLLKQSIWYAKSVGFEIVYLTVFQRQKSLIDLLMLYGFTLHSIKRDGELVYAKNTIKLISVEDPYDWHLKNYPNLNQQANTAVVIPIKPEFHKRLLPEATFYRAGTTLDLFESTWTSKTKEHHIPATSIRKVYVCKSQTKTIPRGSLIYFYVTKNDELTVSQGLSAIGVLEDYKEIDSVEALLELTAKRSVYRQNELLDIFSRSGPTRVLNFIIVGICQPILELEDLKKLGVLAAAPQSIVQLNSASAKILASDLSTAYLV